MGLSKIGLNVGKEIVVWARSSGKSLLATKPLKLYTTELKYAKNIKTDTFKKQCKVLYKDEGEFRPPYTKEGETQVVGHHDFSGFRNGMNTTLEELIKDYNNKYPNATKEQFAKSISFLKKNNAIIQLDAVDTNREFLKLKSQPYESVVYRGRSRRIGEDLGSDFDIINKAKIGDEVVPTKGFAYAAHYEGGTYQYMGSPYDINGKVEFEPMMIEYRIPKGSQVSSNYEHGGEVVFPAFSKFKLLSKETREAASLDMLGRERYRYPYKHVVLEYIPDIPVLNKKTLTEAEANLLIQKAGECKSNIEFFDLIKSQKS
jgi:hypothetical protein